MTHKQSTAESLGCPGLGIAEVVALFVAPAASPLLAVGSLEIDLVPGWTADLVVALFVGLVLVGGIATLTVSTRAQATGIWALPTVLGMICVSASPGIGC